MKVIDEIHNHVSTLNDVYSTFKKIAMIEQIKNKIFRALKMQISFDRIIFNLCVVDSVTEISFTDSTNLEIINFMFSFRDSFIDSKKFKIVNFMFLARSIYNMKTQLRQKFLKLLIFIQTLIRKLDQKN